MARNTLPGIYLIIEFDWPQPFEDEFGQLAADLHRSIQEHDWIEEVFTASGGVGGDLSSMWVFWLQDYAGLDRLFKDRSHPVSLAYNDFFSQMSGVHERIREEVIIRVKED